jgi:hypothetical protein
MWGALVCYVLGVISGCLAGGFLAGLMLAPHRPGSCIMHHRSCTYSDDSERQQPWA